MIEGTVIQTGGDGLWSQAVKEVRLTRLTIDTWQGLDEDLCGEMRVYFDTATWDVYTDGLIYTDEQFKGRLAMLLKIKGFDADDWFGYSEQGMQGRDFVSFDIGGQLLEELITQARD